MGMHLCMRIVSYYDSCVCIYSDSCCGMHFCVEMWELPQFEHYEIIGQLECDTSHFRTE